MLFSCALFEKDEPYLEIIQAARLIDASVCLYITGRYQRPARIILDQAPSQCGLTGFFSDQDYINLLYSCDVVMDLTLMQDCLVCGAYEAVALGKLVILSDTEALKKLFLQRGCIYRK